MVRCTVPAAIAVLLAGTAPAAAHAFLEHASPRVGSRIATSPTVLDLSFTESVVPHLSRVQLLSSSNQAMRTGSLRSDKDGRDLIVPVPPLPPGQYTVVWHVTSQTMHKTEGRFSFTVTR